MVLKRSLFYSFLFCVGMSVQAQQNEIYNQFFMNPYLYNPAYAGVEGHSVLFVMYHQQWSNFENSPSMVHATFHTPLRGGIGLGATAYNISQGGLLNKTIGKVSGSYLLTIDRKHYLRFGLSLGGGTQSVNFGELDNPSDPAFTELVTDNSFAIADFGATYHFDHFNVGFSIPNLVSYNTFQRQEFAEVRVKPLDNMIIKMNYRGHINNDIAIEPHLLYRYSRFSPDQYEATVIAHIYHIVWVGLTYRQENNFIATLGTKIKEKIGIGYAYEMGNTNIRNFLGPTHEIHIGYHLGTKKDHVEHVSSFIKSHRLSAEERARRAALERQRAEAAREQEDDDQLGIIGQADEEPVAEEPTSEEPIEEEPIEEEPIEEEPIEEEPVEEEPVPVVTPTEDKEWEIDTQHQQVSRVNESGQEETSVIVTHENEEGEKEYAIAWKPSGENWSLVKETTPEKRTTPSGKREVKITYQRIAPNGQQETISKWEPVLNEQQLEEALKVEEEPVQEPIEEEDSWEIDPVHQPVSRINESGQEETSVIVAHENEAGEKEYAIAWKPQGENWSLVKDTTPEKRTNQQGQREVEITYQQTTTDGQQETISKWEPVLSEQELEKALKQPKDEPVRDEPVLDEPVLDETVRDDPVREEPAQEEPVEEDEQVTDVMPKEGETHDEVSSGDHMLELPTGIYVIGGAFRSFENAENYSDKLFLRGFRQSLVGYVSERQLYYTVVYRTDNMQEALEQKERISQRSGMKDVWILKVN